MNIFEKVKEHKSDLLLLSGLFLFFVFLSSIFLFRQGSIIIDSFGQNLYIPMEMLKGKVLYKDIIVPYGPFSYQINAILMMFFGANLNTVHFAGAINSLIILLLVYLISRNITGKALSFTVTFLVMVICVFHFWITNYIFPYSTAMTYSLTAFLASVFCSIRYLKKSTPLYILLAFVFIGISVLIKLDFLFFAPVLLLLALFIKPVSKKYLVITAAASLVVPLLSWLVLFIQGVTFLNLYDILLNIREFAQSEAFKGFYANYTGMFFNPRLINLDMSMLKTVVINLSITAAIIYLYFLALQKIFKFLKVKLNYLVLFLFTIPIYLIFLKQYYVDLFSNMTFAWMPITTTLILISVLIYTSINIRLFEVLKNNFSFINLINALKLISLKQRIFIFLCIAAIIASMRCYFFLNLQIFGTFVFPLVLLVNIVFWVDYLPAFLTKYFKYFNIEIWRKSWVISMVILGLVFSINYMSIAKGNAYPLKTSKGTYYLRGHDVQAFSQVITYINKHAKKDDTLIALPRGLSINVFTNLSSDNKYYDFIPPTIAVHGEDKIIDNIRSRKPRFILLTNEDSTEWGASYVCRDYALNICSFIYENYQYKNTFGNDFKISLYEIKQ